MKQTVLGLCLSLWCVCLYAQQTVHKTLLFDFDKSTIIEAAKVDLEEMVNFLKNYPSATLTLHGHTDNFGSNAYNQQLSLKRVEAVADYLLNRGIDAKQLILKPFGESKPLVENSTNENRQKNRRVTAVWQVPEKIVAQPKPQKKVIEIVKKAKPSAPKKISPFAQLTPKPNHFHFYCHQDTVLIGKDGTKVFVKANSFAVNCGEETLIRLELQEAVDKETMLKKDLYTITTDGQPLESYGMIELTAYIEGQGQPLDLKEGEVIGFEVPSYVGEADVNIYNGVEQSNGLRWKKSEIEQTYLTQGNRRGLSNIMGWINFDKPCMTGKDFPLLVKIPKIIEQQSDLKAKIYFKDRNIILPLLANNGKPFIFDEGAEVMVWIREINKYEGYKSEAKNDLTITKPSLWSRIWNRNRIILQYEPNPVLDEALGVR